jgi:hypothetical protein
VEEGIAPLFQRDCDPVDTLAGLGALLGAMAEGAHDDGARSAKSNLFPLMTDLEAEALTPLQGILGDILYEDSLAFLYGRSGWWKSFLVLSWALCVAAGVDWLGKTAITGDVIYVCAEGARGVGKRITAWKHHHGMAGQSVRLHVLGVPVHLLHQGETDRLVRSIKAKSSKPVLVVIDTLARAMAGGNENDTQDAGALIAAADLIRTEFKCCVLFVHHVGVADTSRQRGSSAFRGAADMEIRVAAMGAAAQKDMLEPGDVIQVTCQKPKDSDGFAPVSLTTGRQTWATDEGQILGSLVIVHAQAAAVGQESEPVPNSWLLMLQALHGHPEGPKASEWEKASGVPHGTFYNHKPQVIAAGYAHEKDSRYFLTPKGLEFVQSKSKQSESGPDGPAGLDEHHVVQQSNTLSNLDQLDLSGKAAS